MQHLLLLITIINTWEDYIESYAVQMESSFKFMMRMER